VDAEGIVQSVRRHIAARRQEIADKFPKKLSPDEYQRHCGRHEELESLAAVVQDAVRRANSAESTGEDNDDPDA
jgi:hypothetical protein